MQIFNFIRHLDQYIGDWIVQFGPWSYGILFLVVFAETGLVVTPFLPGDTLLFAAGIFAHPDKNGFNLPLLLIVLTLAPLCGDTVNYHLGKWLGPKLFSRPNSRIFKRENLDQTHAFFEKYGGKAVVIARWVPIVRTFAPFVAGMGAMEYRKFFGFSLFGAFLWVWVCVLAGYFFGQIPWVSKNFEIAMLAMIAISGGPILFEMMKHKKKAKAARTGASGS